MLPFRPSMFALAATLASCTGASQDVAAAPPAPTEHAMPTPPIPCPELAQQVPKAAAKSTASEACAAWLASSPELARYLAEGADSDAGAAAATPTTANLDEPKLATAFHQLLLAFLQRDAKALLALLPATGQLTVVNTLEAATGTRDVSELRKQLAFRRGPLYANLLAGEDDDYADRFALRAAVPWCRIGASFYLLGDHPADISFVRFSSDPSPKLLAFGTAGL